jgi:WD40 repeat protein
MKKLNIINNKENKKNVKIELIAVGCENEIILFNILNNYSIYQTINEHTNIVYSLAQFEDTETFLFSSSKDKYLNIYKLDNNQNYILYQKLKKAVEKTGGEIGKVITLSNKLLLTGDHKSITIWKQSEESGEIKYKDFYNILVNGEVCNLLEMTKTIFVASKNSENGPIQIFQNDEKEFPLIGEINDISIHNSTTNGLSKINDIYFCVAGKGGSFYVVSINPVEMKLKIKVEEKKDIFFIYVTKNNYLYCNGGEKDIMQYKILFNNENKEDNVKIIEVGRINIYSKGLTTFLHLTEII